LTRKPSKSNLHRYRRPLLIASLIVAISLVGVILYAVGDNPNRVALSMTTFFSIGIVSRDGQNVRFILPDQSIGVPGGFMATTRYLGDGIKGNYPMYSSPYSCGNIYGNSTVCAISVLSRVVRSYTLGDFFAVWGVPLGPDETLNAKFTSNMTGSPPEPDYSWTMCTFHAGKWLPSFEWGSHILVDKEVVLLDFGPQDYPCA